MFSTPVGSFGKFCSRAARVYIERQQRLLRANTGPLPEVWDADTQFIDACVEVADGFGVELVMPEYVSDENLDSLAFLKGLLDGTLPVGGLTVEMTRPADSFEHFVSACASDLVINLRHPGTNRQLFGTAIATGPYAVELRHLALTEPQRAADTWERTAVGEYMGESKAERLKEL